MTSDEILLNQLQAENRKLRIRLEKLEPKPHGSAGEVFAKFWEARPRNIKGMELAALAFDEGHQLRHKK